MHTSFSCFLSLSVWHDSSMVMSTADESGKKLKHSVTFGYYQGGPIP
jgi:hypothetical protein